MIIYLLPLVVLMSCLVAYLGDYLGRLLGKRRLTLCGLRPKHTAILITVLTGMLISSATLSCVMFVDSDVRRAILQFPQILADLDIARHDARIATARALTASQRRAEEELRLQKTLNDEGKAEADVRSANARLTSTKQELGEKVTALSDLQRQKRELDNVLRGLQGTNQSLRDENGSLGRRERSLGAEITKISASTKILNKSRIDAERRLEDASRRRDELRVEEARLSSSLQDVEKSLDDEKSQLASLTLQKNNLDDQNHALGLANERLQNQSDALQNANGMLAMQNEQAGEELKRTNQQLDEAKGLLQRLSLIAVREQYDSTHNKTIFEPDQLLVQGVVDCSQPESEIRRNLEDLIKSAVDTARHAGASPDDPLTLLDRDTVTRTPDEVLDDFLAQIRSHRGQVVVRVKTLWRIFLGNQVIAGLSSVPYRRIFERGETIATRELDGRGSERSIRNEVAAFLAEDVRPNAIARGMLPDANNQISTDILDKLLDVSHEVHQKRRPVQVQVVAAADTWCSQPLDLLFRVE